MAAARILSIVPIVVLGRATLMGGQLDPLPLRRGILGEERVAGVLAELEPEGYRTLHGLDIGRGDADHVLVGPTGVYVIETKEWSGRFYPRRGRLMFNQRPADEVVSQVTAAALAVKHRLERAGIDVWVQAVIASTSAKVYASPLRLGHVTALEAGDLPGFVRGRRPVARRGRPPPGPSPRCSTTPRPELVRVRGSAWVDVPDPRPIASRCSGRAARRGR